MKRVNLSGPPTTRRAALLAAGLLLGMTQQQALAVGTASSTPIANTATITYAVGGITQTDVPSNTVSFVVDNKIDLNVVIADAAAVPVLPGQVAATPVPTSPAYLTYTVTNLGNTTQDILLSNTTPAAGATSPFGGTTEFAASSCRTFVETGGGAGLQIGTDTETSYLDNVPASGASSRTVYLVCSTPLTPANGQDAAVGLVAQAVDAAGSSGSPSAAYTVGQLTAANTALGVEIVAADGAGSETGDATRDAKFSARDAYIVQTATLAVTKTVTTLCDPFNGITNPKNIPGAMVRWTITVENTGSASATLATITDALNTNTTQDPNLVAPTNAATCSSAAGTPESAAGRGFQIESSAATRPLGGQATTGYMTGLSDADGATLSGSNVTIDFAKALPAGTVSSVTWTAGELKAGETATVTFNVTVN
jgi:uncharacterized repeat protein (TIGR01451 family)